MRYKKTSIISLLLTSIYYQLNSMYAKLDCKSHALKQFFIFIFYFWKQIC